MPPRDEANIRGWLDSRIGSGMRLGLSTCAEMLERLGNPERDFPSVHVAGTNGKGSLCAQLSALGSKNGLLIGLFTSPHLVTVEERTRVDGTPVLPSEFDRFLHEVREASEIEPEIRPTYFEVTFLASMLAFSEAGVDRAIVETGLGGRLDSTRLVAADICAITTISMDHTEVLGESLGEIASEKAGIHRDGVPMFCLYHEDSVVREAIESVGGDDVEWIDDSRVDAQSTARAISQEIGRKLGWSELETEVSWPGRTKDAFNWNGVECRLSAAHNKESIAHDFAQVSDDEHVLVIGMTQKEELASTIEPLLGSESTTHTIVTSVEGGRKPSAAVDEIAELFDAEVEIEVISDNSEAMERAVRIASENDCIVYVTGSVYLVGSVYSEFLSMSDSNLWDHLAVHPPRSQTEG
ncbi:MAG: Mur ligase family protein [Candidatus Thalassarchaeaceae archaeon]|nr:Mur ligase family protein [Candidatus Thalassarchaeaceae archaeon]